MPSPADRVSREEIEAAVAALLASSGGHFEALRDVDEEWFVAAAKLALSAAASVRQEPDWEGALRELALAVGHEHQASIDAAYKKAVALLERAAGEGDDAVR